MRRNTIGDGDGIENDGLTTLCIHPFRCIVRQRVDVHVAGRHHAPGGSDPYLGFLEILVGESDSVQHGATRGALHAVNNL